MTRKEPKWERVNSDTERLDIPDGWLYRVITPSRVLDSNSPTGLTEDLKRRGMFCQEKAGAYPAGVDTARLIGKATAYEHAAELLAAALKVADE